MCLGFFANQGLAEEVPVEEGTGIGFAAGCDMFVSRNIGKWIAGAQCVRQCSEPLILNRLEWIEIRPFELDADGKVVAALAATKR